MEERSISLQQKCNPQCIPVAVLIPTFGLLNWTLNEIK